MTITQEQLHDIYRADSIVRTGATSGKGMYRRDGRVTRGVPISRGAPKGIRRAHRNKYHWLNQS